MNKYRREDGKDPTKKKLPKETENEMQNAVDVCRNETV